MGQTKILLFFPLQKYVYKLIKTQALFQFLGWIIALLSFFLFQTLYMLFTWIGDYLSKIDMVSFLDFVENWTWRDTEFEMRGLSDWAQSRI